MHEQDAGLPLHHEDDHGHGGLTDRRVPVVRQARYLKKGAVDVSTTAGEGNPRDAAAGVGTAGSRTSARRPCRCRGRRSPRAAPERVPAHPLHGLQVPARRRGWRSSSPRCRPGRRSTPSAAAASWPTRSRRAAATVLANDHLTFTSTLAEALVANEDEQLTPRTSTRICSPNRDGRDFIATTFDGLYFPRADHAFLDAAWSHMDELAARKRALALSALCLAAAQKQPRGVFTVTTPRYDDGRRQFRMSLEALFREAVERCNAAVIPGAARARCGDVFDARPAGRRDRLPRSALRAAARRHLLRQALPLPRRAGDVLARARRSCGRRARASWPSGRRRSAPSAPPAALDRLFDHFARGRRPGGLLRLQRRARPRRN